MTTSTLPDVPAEVTARDGSSIVPRELELRLRVSDAEVIAAGRAPARRPIPEDRVGRTRFGGDP